MAEDPFNPVTGRLRVWRGDWSFMTEGTEEQAEPEDSDDDEDQSSDG